MMEGFVIVSSSWAVLLGSAVELVVAWSARLSTSMAFRAHVSQNDNGADAAWSMERTRRKIMPMYRSAMPFGSFVYAGVYSKRTLFSSSSS